MKLTPINSTAIEVEWRPPAEDEQNGIIRGFLVTYLELNERNEPVGSPRVYDLQNGEQTRVVVTGLEPDTRYQFQIAAYTRQGDGVRSRAKKEKTKGAGECANRRKAKGIWWLVKEQAEI